MAETLTARAFADGLVAEFSTALESVLGTPVVMAMSEPGAGAGWVVLLTLSGSLRGTITVWINQPDAAALAQRVLGTDEPPDEPTVIDMLGEMWTQATSALGLKEPFTGVKAALTPAAAGAPGPDSLAAYELSIGDVAAGRLSIAGRVSAEPAPAPAVKAAAPAGSSVDVSSKLELVLDIDLPMVVRFGRTSMSLKALADLGPGSIVDMGRSPDEPVEMLVGDRVIARGEVVVVGGNYGVRIMDLVSPAERVRALEG
jgi:flagellar motor switch protein FliN/FliY